ncbi:unnamed protein product [Lota lota]
MAPAEVHEERRAFRDRPEEQEHPGLTRTRTGPGLQRQDPAGLDQVYRDRTLQGWTRSTETGPCRAGPGLQRQAPAGLDQVYRDSTLQDWTRSTETGTCRAGPGLQRQHPAGLDQVYRDRTLQDWTRYTYDEIIRWRR